MSDKLNSEQERRIWRASQILGGGPYLFIPDDYQKNPGGATREPADLVWYFLDCAVLYYMQDTLGGEAKADVHNLKQAKGWLKAWKRGRKLTGRNRLREFSIDFSACKYILVVSVVPSSDGVFRLDREAAKAFDVVAFATVPEYAFGFLAQRDCGIADFLAVLLMLAGEIDRPEGYNGSALIQSYLDFVSSKLPPTAAKPDPLYTHSLKTAGQLMRVLRPPEAVFPGPLSDVDSTKIIAPLVELGLLSFTRIVHAVASGLVYVEVARNREIGEPFAETIELPTMRVCVQVARSLDPTGVASLVDQITVPPDKLLVIILIGVVADLGPLQMMAVSGEHSPGLHELLEHLKAVGRGAGTLGEPIGAPTGGLE